MMKKLLFISIAIFLFNNINAQEHFISYKDEKNPSGVIYKGIISKDIIQKEKAFNWFDANKSAYNPSPELLHAFLASSAKVSFIIFGGTWCEDTQGLLPQFYKLQELTGLKDDKIVLFGVDREKKTIDNIAQAFNITNVPTIIVMKDGKELGRVVEYGSSGNWDDAMTNLLK